MTTQPSYPIITPFEAVPTAIDGLYIITMKQVTDERGTVRELFRQSAMDSTPLPQSAPGNRSMPRKQTVVPSVASMPRQ